MYAWSTNMLLLLHSAFMLSVVKMLLKGEVGDRALNSHGNYIVDHGIVVLNLFDIKSIPNKKNETVRCRNSSKYTNPWPILKPIESA